jgi:predicted nucleic acid-binding protein
MALEIDKISFASKLKELELNSYVESLKNYRDGFEKAIELEEDIPIFVDTNILLRYYDISFSSRKSLLAFLRKNKKSIYITSQVQKEYVKNRENGIEDFFNETLKKLEDNFKEEIKNKVQSYTERNKLLLQDFPKFEGKLAKISTEIDKTLEQLSIEVEDVKKKLHETKYEDELLALIQEMNLLKGLSEEDIKHLKTEFDNLKKPLDISKLKSEIKKPQVAFPGLSDIKEKPNNPYGDYILFHEMVRFLKKENRDAIFLTYDTTKGDWLKENREPHSHYIQLVYLATGRILYYVDAERFFDSHLKQHFNSVVPKKDYYSPKSEYEKSFILEFVSLERIIRTIAEFVVIEQYEYLPLHKLIDIFLERNYIDKNFKRDFHELNNFRNLLTHSPSRERIDLISEEEFLILYGKLEMAIHKMNQLYSDL